MKKTFVLAWILGFVLTGCSRKEAEPDIVTPPEQPYDLSAEAFEPNFESQEYGFRVKGPEGWVKEADSLGMLVTYLKPGDPETFQENITIARELKAEGAELKSYAAQTRDQILEYFPEAQLQSETSTTVGGLSAEKFRFILTVGGLTLETEQVVVERANEFMVFTFMSLPEQFPAAFAEFNKLLSSVEFVGN